MVRRLWHDFIKIHIFHVSLFCIQHTDNHSSEIRNRFCLDNMVEDWLVFRVFLFQAVLVFLSMHDAT